MIDVLKVERAPDTRRDHLEHLQACLKGATPHLIVLRGGMAVAERRAVDAALQASEGEERLLLATGRYLGEGFDDPRLDTLFLTMPILVEGDLSPVRRASSP